MRTDVFFALCLAASCSTSSGAADAYPRPSIGDRWAYEQFQEGASGSTSNGNAEFRAAWWSKAGSLEILARHMPEDKVSAQTKEQRSVLHASLKKGHCVFSITDGQALLHGNACEKPLVTGQSWEFRESGGRTDGTYKLTVVGEEEIAVPAGTVRAIKLAASWMQSSEGKTPAPSRSIGRGAAGSRSTYWYVPEIKSMARLERVFLDESHRETGRITEVLRAYIPGPPSSAPQ